MCLWDKKGMPQRNWYFIAMEELDEAEGVCEMCGKEGIKYCHIMGHNNYPRAIYAGSVCAIKMQLPYEYGGAQLERVKKEVSDRETKFKNKIKRRISFVNSKRWKISQKGNLYIKNKGGVLTVIKGPYGYGVFDSETEKTVWEYKKQKIKDEFAAKNAAFEIVEAK